MTRKKLASLLLLMPLSNSLALELSIPSYPELSVIPDDYTYNGGSNCSGANVSPQLIWSDAPPGTQSYAVVFIDENFDWLHWKLYNIDPSVTHIPENNPNDVGTEGMTDFGINGYGGPCPPLATPGNYQMTIHALNTAFANDPSVTDIQNATIESASYLAFRNINDQQARYEYKARYKLTFNANWSAITHPTNYPSNAHFSPLIGNSHNLEGYIWEDGGISTDGMEQMAETGGTSMLRNEIRDLIDASGAESLITGSGASGVDSVSLFFEVSESHPLFSMVTMIAPSPDWFVGVHDLDLRSQGQWLSNMSIDLYPFDAGTQDGNNFTPPGANTNPRAPIHRITTSPFANNVPLGQFVFELQSIEGEPSDVIFINGFDL